MARRMDAELYVIHVDREFGPRETNLNALTANLRFGENLGAKRGEAEGEERGGFGRGLCAVEAHYAGDFRACADA